MATSKLLCMSEIRYSSISDFEAILSRSAGTMFPVGGGGTIPARHYICSATDNILCYLCICVHPVVCYLWQCLMR